MILQDLLQDLRVTLRGLFRSPMMTFTIVVTVGLGIGATTVIFSAIHAALLQPLPYADPGRLVRIYTDAPPNRFRFSVADYQALHAEHMREKHLRIETRSVDAGGRERDDRRIQRVAHRCAGHGLDGRFRGRRARAGCAGR